MSKWAEVHLPCPKSSCGSSDAYAIDVDGAGYCFSCGHATSTGGKPRKIKAAQRPVIPMQYIEYTALPKRKLKTDTLKGFKYGWASFGGKKYQVATYMDDRGRPVGQKLRGPKKKFFCLGEINSGMLYNKHRCQAGSKMLVVTEGEIDALSVAQVMNWKTVVSVPSGAKGAAEAVKKNLGWLSTFEKVVFCFDGDEPGRNAAEDCAKLLPPGKAFIVSMEDGDDANELLKQGRSKELTNAIYGADQYKVDGIVTIADIKEKAAIPTEQGIPWPWEQMNELTFGRRRKELYAFGAGTGIGKTDVFTQVMEYTLMDLGLPVGGIYLEQPPEETLKRIAGKAAQKRFHVPDGSWTKEELVETLDYLEENGKLFLYDHFGGMEWDTVESIIRTMVASGAKDIFLDHLTALASSDGDERLELDRLMKEAASLVHELDFTLYFISHLNTPKGRPHEEGGRVSVRNFRGSRALGFWSNFMWGLERNPHDKNRDRRTTTCVRCIKDRFTGNATGESFYLKFDQSTGMLNEVEPPQDIEDFEEEDGYDAEDY